MEKKSPLKAKPLRQPGQSVQEEIDNIIDDKLLLYVLAPVMLIVFAFMEWIKWFFHSPPSPYLISITAIGATIYYSLKIVRLRSDVKNLKLGRDGEKAVGQFLELLREEGCLIFHDIVGDGFNIDHVVVSEKGIYLIETKTYSKPSNGEPKIYFDGVMIKVDGVGDKTKILKQVDAASNWLSETLQESTGKEFKIKPVILFPGWYVESSNHNNYWLLNPKAFPKFIQNQKEILSKEEKKLASYHLGRYIRSL